MARETQDGTNAAFVLTAMMVCGLLLGPLLALSTRLPISIAMLMGSGLPLAVAGALRHRSARQADRRLAARVRTEAVHQGALCGLPVQTGPADRTPGPQALSARTSFLLLLAVLCAVVQGTAGGVLSCLLLAALWMGLLCRWRCVGRAGRAVHGDTQIGLVQARSEMVRGIRLSSQRAGRSPSDNDRQSR
ncbi:MAG: hypothetical protein VX265_14960, partial [Myxococcota bacterium]|nr:hypothetical protein [Myxococcota bacterium]